MNGVLLIDKPVGISSFDCVRELRRVTGERKIGHAGTLDPLASGLMIMLFGAATKRAAEFSKLDKTYVAEITLGETSTTDDNEGEKTAVSTAQPTKKEIEQALYSFVGRITQTPPQFSAIKVGGRRAYKSARAGQDVTIEPREVTIHSAKLLGYIYPKVRFVVRVSSGTYIRSLARDLGEKLSAGAYLSGLVRTSIGDIKLESAAALSAIQAHPDFLLV